MSRFSAPPILVKIATGRNFILLFCLFIAFSGFIMPSVESDIKAMSGGVGVMDLQPFYTPEKARAMLGAYGPEGTRLYLIAQWTVDFIFPIISGLMFAVGLIWAGGKRWWWMGLILTLVDWSENVLITALLMQYPSFSPQLAWVSCFFTSAKWSVVLCSNLLFLYFGGKKLLAHRVSMEKRSLAP